MAYSTSISIRDVVAQATTPLVDGILADLGISTNQLFDPDYGLSFAQAMPLDMRIDPRIRQTAADLVNSMREDGEKAAAPFKSVGARHGKARQ